MGRLVTLLEITGFALFVRIKEAEPPGMDPCSPGMSRQLVQGGVTQSNADLEKETELSPKKMGAKPHLPPPTAHLHFALK